MSCCDATGWTETAVTLGVAALVAAGGLVWTRLLARRGAPDARRGAFALMDELDAREAEGPEYEAPMAVLRSGPLPAWGAAMAVERLSDREGPSRRRYLELLRGAVPEGERGRLAEIARDATDPLASEVWSVLTGRPAAEWARALIDSDGGADERRFMA